MSLISDSSKLLSFLLRFSRGMRRARLSIALVVATGVVAGLAGTVLLGLINAVLSRGGMAQRWQLLLFIGLCLALPLSRMASAAMLLHFSSRALAELRIRMARSVLALPLRTLEEKGAHRVLTALTQDISAIATAITNIPTLCMQVFIVLGSLAYLGWLSWKALLVVIVFLVVGIITYQLPVSIAMRYFAIARQKIEELMKHFQAITEGAKELRLNRRRSTALLTQGIELAAHATQRSSFRAYTIYIGATSWGQMLFFVLVGAVLFAVPAVSSADRLVLTGYCLVILYMMTPLESIMTTLPTLGQAAVSVAAIEQLGLPLGEDLRQLPASPEVHASWRSIELKEVCYAYPREDGGVFTLGPLNLEIRPGRLIFLTGGNGSGKTTLAKLITGLYIPTQGEIRIDGEPVTEENRDGYRQLFSAVFFDFFLFEQLFAGEDRDVEERAREQLVRMQLAHKVEVHGDTLSTIDLSQGQRRRLALLSAVLEDRPIYVFDEWAADQDAQFREIFYLQILPELKARGKTVVVISHDDRYFDLADDLVKLDYGRLARPHGAALPAHDPVVLQQLVAEVG